MLPQTLESPQPARKYKSRKSLLFYVATCISNEPYKILSYIIRQWYKSNYGYEPGERTLRRHIAYIKENAEEFGWVTFKIKRELYIRKEDDTTFQTFLGCYGDEIVRFARFVIRNQLRGFTIYEVLREILPGRSDSTYYRIAQAIKKVAFRLGLEIKGNVAEPTGQKHATPYIGDKDIVINIHPEGVHRSFSPPETPKMRRLTESEIRNLKHPNEKLTPKMRGLVGVMVKSMRKLHYDNCKVDFDPRVAHNFAARALLMGHRRDRIESHYLDHLRDIHGLATDEGTIYSNGSVVHRALNSLCDDGWSVNDRWNRNAIKPFPKREEDNIEGSVVEFDQKKFLRELDMGERTDDPTAPIVYKKSYDKKAYKERQRRFKEATGQDRLKPKAFQQEPKEQPRPWHPMDGKPAPTPLTDEEFENDPFVRAMKEA